MQVKTYHTIEAVKGNLGAVRVRGVEPCIGVYSSSTFTKRVDEWLDPLNQVLWPKLTQIASIYAKFRPNRIRVMYRHRCPATTTGQVGACFITNANSTEAPADMMELDRYTDAESCAAWSDFDCIYERKSNAFMWYTITNARVLEDGNTALGTLRTSAFGSLQVFSDGGGLNPNNTLLGNIYIEYDFDFEDYRPAQLASGTVKLPPITYLPPGSGTYYGYPIIGVNIADQLKQASFISGYVDRFLDRLQGPLLPFSGGVPSYVSSMGLLTGAILTASQAIKMRPGKSLFSIQSLLSAINIAVDRPRLVRQVANSELEDYAVYSDDEKVKRIRDEFGPVPTAVKTLGGQTWFQFVPDGPWVLQPDGDRTKSVYSPLTTGNCQIVACLWDPTTNTASNANVSVAATTIGSTTLTGLVEFTNSNNYPTWVIPYVYQDMGGVANSRSMTSTLMMTNENQ